MCAVAAAASCHRAVHDSTARHMCLRHAIHRPCAAAVCRLQPGCLRRPGWPGFTDAPRRLAAWRRRVPADAPQRCVRARMCVCVCVCVCMCVCVCVCVCPLGRRCCAGTTRLIMLLRPTWCCAGAAHAARVLHAHHQAPRGCTRTRMWTSTAAWRTWATSAAACRTSTSLSCSSWTSCRCVLRVLRSCVLCCVVQGVGCLQLRSMLHPASGAAARPHML
jgi:hypothetical protein